MNSTSVAQLRVENVNKYEKWKKKEWILFLRTIDKHEIAVISDSLCLAPMIRQEKATKYIFWFHQGESQMDFHCKQLFAQVLHPIRNETQRTQHDLSGNQAFAVSLWIVHTDTQRHFTSHQFCNQILLLYNKFD